MATAVVEEKGGYYSGTIDLGRMPECLLKVFDEYERLVNDQVLGLLDQIEERIQNTPLIAVFADGHEASATDVQVFPKAGTVSFRAAREHARADQAGQQ